MVVVMYPLNHMPEIERMEAEGFRYTKREGLYQRISDGRTVKAVDWPDGDVTWVLEPLPLIAPHCVGTCSAKTFAKNYRRVL